MTDPIMLVYGRTRDSWKSSLAEVQGHHLRAIGDENNYMAEKWQAEETRIKYIVDNFDLLSVPQGSEGSYE